MTPIDGHLDKLAIERASVGEIPDDVRAHLANCEVCQQRVGALRAQAEAFVAEQPFDAFVVRPAIAVALKEAEGRRVHRLSPRASRSDSGALRWYAAGGLAVAASLTAVVLLVEPSSPSSPSSSPGVRLKGASTIEAIRLREGVQSSHDRRVSVRAGDGLRFRLRLIAPSRVRAVLTTHDGARVIVASGGRDAGAHVIPDDALWVTSPVEPGRLEVLVESDDNVERLSFEVVPES